MIMCQRVVFLQPQKFAMQVYGGWVILGFQCDIRGNIAY
jgi:hypothetical protein